MAEGVNFLESILGKELFHQYVQVLMTDREGEFVSSGAFEKRSAGTKNSMVFSCDPTQSGQKETLDNNHIHSAVEISLALF